MKKLIFCVGFGLISLMANSQTIIRPSDAVIYVYSAEENDVPGVKRGAYSETHMLGDEVRELAHQIERAYVYYQATGGAYAMEEKIVHKPNLYKTYKRLDDYYTEGAADGSLSVTSATPEAIEMYEILLKLINYETEAVEKDLRKIKKPEQIVKYLSSLKFQ